jgi:hypothetical protein
MLQSIEGTYSNYYCNGVRRGCGGVPPRRGSTPAPRTSPERETLYKDGKVELIEVPHDVHQSRVIVTFLEVKSGQSSEQMQFGMFSGTRQSTEEDFKLSEFQRNQRK